jgi:hypothetical protein
MLARGLELAGYLSPGLGRGAGGLSAVVGRGGNAPALALALELNQASAGSGALATPLGQLMAMMSAPDQPNPSSAPEGNIPQGEVDAVKARWTTHPGDPGMGVYNIETGEIHLSTGGQVGGHPTLAGIHSAPPHTAWRGFVFNRQYGLIPRSSLNYADGVGGAMAGRYQSAVEAALRKAGLIG